MPNCSVSAENDLIQEPISKLAQAIRKHVLGRSTLNIQIATNVIGMYVIEKIMLVIVTSSTGTPKARASGAATGVSDV